MTKIVKGFGTINTVFFDVGGVLIKDFSKTNKWEEMLNDFEFTQDQRDTFKNLFFDYERSNRSVKEKFRSWF